MNSTVPYIHRDISWLSFNYRVLQEAMDLSVPLLERIKFLAIYSSNLDEFFRVRVANHRNLARAGKKTQRQVDFEPIMVLKEILKVVNQQQVEFSEIFENRITSDLKANNIYIKRRGQLDPDQKIFVENYFNDNLLPYVQPVLLVKDKIKPFLNTGSLYLAIHIQDKSNSKALPEYAIVNIPSDHVPRFIVLPNISTKIKDVILLDDIVRHCIPWIFPGYDIIDSFSIKLTRDAELYIDDEFSGDLIEKVKKSLIKRNVGPASRLVYDRTMPKHFLQFLMEAFGLNKLDLLPEGRYHNNSDFFKFPSFSLTNLKDQALPAIPITELENADSIFHRIRFQDYLVFVPYHSYESVVKFFEDAASDNTVTHIKIVQYRVAKNSRVMKALMNAVKSGKQVSAFIEIKARFDEEANLAWGEKLEAAGVNVHYSMPGLKVHAKMALVRRLEDGIPVMYSYLSTGNFHEDTAKLYSDIGLFTCDERLTTECTRLFSYLETKQLPTVAFEHLAVGQFNLKEKLIQLIENEIKNVENGGEAKIMLKMNSLQDMEMIKLLYKASQAGVKIKLIIRGICSLVSGVKGISENIQATSIVDRFLEHMRLFVFHNNGDPLYYMSSADWMVRNLHHRIETMIPIYDQDIKNVLQTIINIQLNDNVKSRLLNHKKINSYKKNDKDLAIRSQLETYFYIKRITDR